MQKPKIKLQINIYLEFWVVFTVSSFVGDPVLMETENVEMSPEKKITVTKKEFRWKKIKIKFLSGKRKTLGKGKEKRMKIKNGEGEDKEWR